MSYLDERLIQLAADTLVMCFYLNGHTGDSGFALFRDKQRIRRRAVDPLNLYVDDGQPLPPEQGFSAADRDDEARIFALSALALGRPLDKIVFADEVMLHIYAKS
jgi:hypothetical protein